MEPLDENDLDLEQLSKGVDDEILAFEAKSNRIREEQISHNTPPPPPSAIQASITSKVGWNNGMEMPASQNAAEAPEASAVGTNFEELD